MAAVEAVGGLGMGERDTLLRVAVEAYAGQRADESLRAFTLGTCRSTVAEALDRWLDPERRYFKVRGDDGGIHILRYDVPSDVWERTLFSAGGACRPHEERPLTDYPLRASSDGRGSAKGQNDPFPTFHRPAPPRNSARVSVSRRRRGAARTNFARPGRRRRWRRPLRHEATCSIQCTLFRRFLVRAGVKRSGSATLAPIR